MNITPAIHLHDNTVRARQGQSKSGTWGVPKLHQRERTAAPPREGGGIAPSTSPLFFSFVKNHPDEKKGTSDEKRGSKKAAAAEMEERRGKEYKKAIAKPTSDKKLRRAKNPTNEHNCALSP